MASSSNLGRWIRRLRTPAPDAATVVDTAALHARDSAVDFAAEHARRYIASDGADDGWDGPRPILVLYTTGRRSGEVRRTPVLYVELDEGRRYVVASKGGADQDPAWYLNLVANPKVQVRVMADVYEATARPLTASERAEVWPIVVERYPMFAEYQATTARSIPVVELVRQPSTAVRQ